MKNGTGGWTGGKPAAEGPLKNVAKLPADRQACQRRSPRQANLRQGHLVEEAMHRIGLAGDQLPRTLAWIVGTVNNFP